MSLGERGMQAEFFGLGSRETGIHIGEMVHDLVDGIILEVDAEVELPRKGDLVDDQLLEVIFVEVVGEDLSVQLLLVAGELVDGFAGLELAIGELVESHNP